MYTYIVIALILFVIAMCIKSSFPKNFIFFGSAIVSALLCIIINCIYFGVNYDKMELVKNVKTEMINNAQLEIVNDSTIRFTEDKNDRYDVIIRDSICDVVILDTINKVTEIDYDFVDNNNWMMISSYPTKKTYKIISLKKEKYDVFKTYQDSICKRKSSL